METADKVLLLRFLADTLQKTTLKDYFGIYADLKHEDKETARMLIGTYRQMFDEITAELKDCQGLLFRSECI